MKYVEVKSTKEYADTVLADPFLRLAVKAVLDNATGIDIVHCRECKKEWCYLRQELGADGYCFAGERTKDE